MAEETGLCPCGSERSYADCCGPVIAGERHAATPEELMRARYTAHVKVALPFIRETLHPDKRKEHDDASTRDWAKNSDWRGLQIVRSEGGGPDDAEGKVEFIASYSRDGGLRQHHEVATFERVDGAWYLSESEMVKPKPIVRETPKIGRNDPCPCGSGIKYKKCHGAGI
jgi:SEC-C motif-containing protein